MITDAMLNATAPFVGVPVPGAAPIVIERLRLQRGLKGVEVVSAEVVIDKMRALHVAYVHPHGKGKAVFYDKYTTAERRSRSGINVDWAHRERHKLGKPCADIHCQIKPAAKQDAVSRIMRKALEDIRYAPATPEHAQAVSMLRALYAERNATPPCNACGKPVDWLCRVEKKYNAGMVCRACREKALANGFSVAFAYTLTEQVAQV